MIMDNNEYPVRDFTNTRSFPGTANNELDTVLHGFEKIQSVSSFVFAVALLAVAAAFSRMDWRFGLILWGFFLLDWALLALLPVYKKSFGPAKPPVTLLVAGRSLAALLPWPANLVLQVLGTVLVIYGFWIEPHRIQVSRQKLVSNKLHSGTKLRVLHLGDLHVERLTERERQLTSLVKSLQPDLILFSGDFLNLSYLTDPAAQAAAREVMQAWQAPLGVFAVKGSPAVDLEESVARVLDGLPIQLLEQDVVTLAVGEDAIRIAGLTCSHKPFIDFPLLRQILESPSDSFTILLYHSPDLAPQAAGLDIDLQLSGHTHGGQVRLPGLGAIVTGSLYGRRFQSGKYSLGNMTLYITRGIGLEGAGAPRVRFLCPPEITVWEISGSDS
jgi:predicted MPP superfamily phosphohydrolase